MYMFFFFLIRQFLFIFDLHVVMCVLLLLLLLSRYSHVDSVGPHRQQPTRLPHPWDSPGKNTGVGCHFLLHCMKVKSESEVAQSCLTLSDPMDFSLPGSSIHGIFQARVLEWGAIAFGSINSLLPTAQNHSQKKKKEEEKSAFSIVFKHYLEPIALY